MKVLNQDLQHAYLINARGNKSSIRPEMTFQASFNRRLTVKGLIAGKETTANKEQQRHSSTNPILTSIPPQKRLLVQKSAVDKLIQTVVPTILRARISYQTHPPLTTGYPEQRHIYDKLRYSFYWPHTLSDMDTKIAQCDNHVATGSWHIRKRCL